ncbi:hypothetical protein AOXY_G34512 [Acipenser oxyrinchus oxyrinchus]|uniref:Uncharacterized protein n=1 Tax=Acipenser oxyrinchus oxyrinchus TaxID=40147 RepID=A0AAD8FSE3_ACIOX|nr:hypothetical protein AOXY_G34512 [Acipenser oxyrinchus oxyrinchus]
MGKPGATERATPTDTTPVRVPPPPAGLGSLWLSLRLRYRVVVIQVIILRQDSHGTVSCAMGLVRVLRAMGPLQVLLWVRRGISWVVLIVWEGSRLLWDRSVLGGAGFSRDQLWILFRVAACGSDPDAKPLWVLPLVAGLVFLPEPAAAVLSILQARFLSLARFLLLRRESSRLWLV